MPMRASDINVGIVNGFIGREINENMPPIIELQRNYGAQNTLTDASRPFVCIGHRDDISQWAEITTTQRAERLLIDVSWRTWQDGNDHHRPNVNWLTASQYINGAVFQGTDEIWALLARDNNSSGHFKIINEEGIRRIREHLCPQLAETNPIFRLQFS